jgi:glycosyltransferase involved in cell wall biosynthesis
VVSVVVPLYRNAATVGELAIRVRAALAEVGDHELLLVEDGSRDGTLEAARAAAEADPAVGVLALSANRGQQRAVLIGLEHARGDWTVVLDGDLQDAPEVIPRLLALAREGGYDAVFAGRRGRYESLPRLLTSKLFKALLGRVAGVPRDAGLFVVLSERMRREIRCFDGGRPFVPAMIGLTGLPATSIPVARERRRRGRSAYRGGMRLAAGLAAVVFALRWRSGRPPGGTAPRGDDLVGARFGACARRRGPAP